MNLNHFLFIGLLFLSTTLRATPPTGEQLYQTRCAVCHTGSVAEAPRFEALQLLSSDAIVTALQTGVMKTQGASLTPDERRLIADYISKLPKTTTAISGQCVQPTTVRLAKPQISSWGMGLNNARYINTPDLKISAKNVGKLTLAWAFAFPDATRARAQPTIVGNTLFTASQHGLIYALDTQTGCIRWTFQADDEVRSAIVVGTDAKGFANRLYFSDFKATVYALDLNTRQLLWKRRVDDHAQATITGTLALHEGRLYVPVSSVEVIAAYTPTYACCTFRGSVVALNAGDGAVAWKTYMTDEPTPQAKNTAGVQNYGPSGAPVWSSPTIDLKRGMLYVGTGENYTRPATRTSDAIVALSLKTGAIGWVQQTVSGDAWNAGCTPPLGPNCPDRHGPDYDFGAPPILVSRPGQPDRILAGQKSGKVFALDPDQQGAIVWQRQVGRGGIMGGVHWGMASDGQTLYVPINDHSVWPEDRDKPTQAGLHALDIADGSVRWSQLGVNRCGDVKWQCSPGLSAPVTLVPGLVLGGSLDGMLHAYNSTDGKVLWEYDTNRDFKAVNGVKGFGGTIDSAGPVVVGDQLFVNSGYAKFGEKAGNVLLAFKINPSSVTGIRQVGLSVRNLDKSVKFYQAVTGMQVAERTRIDKPVAAETEAGFAHASRSVAVLKSQNAQIELVQFDGADKQPSYTMPVPGPGITHVCYQSPATVSIYNKVKANGGTVVSRGTEPIDRGFGIRYSYLRDTEGNLFENEQLDKPPFADSLWVAHVALVTPDIDRLVAFYKQLLGTDPINRIDNIKNSPKLDAIADIDSLKLRAAWFKVGNTVLEIWQFQNPPTPVPTKPAPFNRPGYGQIAFSVENLASEASRLRAGGVSLLSKPASKIVYLRDPDGNLLSLRE